MIKHIVCWKLFDNADGRNKAENMKLIHEKLLELEQKIDEIKKLAVKFNSDLTPGSNYDIALISEFDSIADLDRYRIHPEHLKFVEFIKKVRESKAAIDFEI